MFDVEFNFEFRVCINSFKSYDFQFIRREGNEVAHCLARKEPINNIFILVVYIHMYGLPHLCTRIIRPAPLVIF